MDLWSNLRLGSPSSQSNPSSIAEGDELITPGPSIVHPTAGAIPRRDAQVIEESNRVMFQGIGEQANGTVTPGWECTVRACRYGYWGKKVKSFQHWLIPCHHTKDEIQPNLASSTDPRSSRVPTS